MIRDKLLELGDKLAKKVYRSTINFPWKFQTSIGDQLRRSVLSVILNLVEDNARVSKKEKRQYLNIAFGSLKETKYLLYFSLEFKLIETLFFKETILLVEEMAKIMYTNLYKTKHSTQNT